MTVHKCVPSAECFYCPACKQDVIHQENDPSDTAHCFCRRNYTPDCACRCHAPATVEVYE